MEFEECYIRTLNDFNDVIDGLSNGDNTVFYRGINQSIYNLSPSIARGEYGIERKNNEQHLFEEFRRSNREYFAYPQNVELDVLSIAQHHGLKTRLLDWTINPLSALWFACSKEEVKEGDDPYCTVWVLMPEKEIVSNPDIKNNYFINPADIGKPFSEVCRIIDEEIKNTVIFYPNIVVSRIKNQSGLFTVHNFDKERNEYLPLDENEAYFKPESKLNKPPWKMFKIMINREKYGAEILGRLRLFGIHEETIYPGLDTLCKKINSNLFQTV